MMYRLVFASLCFVLLLTAVTFAQEQEEEVTVEDIFRIVQEGKVVTSTRTERLLKTAPHAVTVITRKQIEESGATTLSEALRFVPGVNARITPMGGQIGIRSFGSTPFSERVLFLIDGTPYNSPDKGGFPGHPAYEDFFPLEAIKRVEVIKGPGSALYGQNAFFGIINIITEDFQNTHQARGSFGSRDTGGVVVRGGDRKDDWRFTYLGKYKQQHGPMVFLADPEDTPLPNLNRVITEGTDVQSGDAYFKASYRDLSLSYLFHRDETDAYSWIKPRNFNPAPPSAVPPFNEVVGCCDTLPTEQTLQFLDATYTKKFTNGHNWRFKAFFNYRNGSTCGNCHDNLNTALAGEDERNRRFFLNSQYDFQIQASHKVIVGADLQFDNTSKDVAQIDTADPSVNTVAGYVQDEISLADDRVILTLGGRVDYNEKTDTIFSPSASAVFLPNENWVIRTLYGRSFRQPTWNDLFTQTIYTPVNPSPSAFLGTGSQAAQQIGNPDVDTEQIDTFEIGTEFFFNPSASVKFDVFFNHVEDYIEAYDFVLCTGGPTDPVDCALALQNLGRPIAVPAGIAVTRNLGEDYDSRGFEIEARFQPTSLFSAIVGYAFQDNDFSQIAGRGTFVDAYSPEHKVTADLNLRPFNSLLFNMSLNYWSEYNTRTFLAGRSCAACTNTDEIGQSFTWANFRTVYTVPAGDQRLKFGFTVRNLFDEEVELSHAFRVDAALNGREYFGTFEVEF